MKESERGEVEGMRIAECGQRRQNSTSGETVTRGPELTQKGRGNEDSRVERGRERGRGRGREADEFHDECKTRREREISGRPWPLSAVRGGPWLQMRPGRAAKTVTRLYAVVFQVLYAVSATMGRMGLATTAGLVRCGDKSWVGAVVGRGQASIICSAWVGCWGSKLRNSATLSCWLSTSTVQ